MTHVATEAKVKIVTQRNQSQKTNKRGRRGGGRERKKEKNEAVDLWIWGSISLLAVIVRAVNIE